MGCAQRERFEQSRLYYTGSVAEADRALATAVAALLVESPTEDG